MLNVGQAGSYQNAPSQSSPRSMASERVEKKAAEVAGRLARTVAALADRLQPYRMPPAPVAAGPVVGAVKEAGPSSTYFGGLYGHLEDIEDQARNIEQLMSMSEL